MTLREELNSEAERLARTIVESAEALFILRRLEDILPCDTVEGAWVWVSPRRIKVCFSSGATEDRQAHVHALIQAIGGKFEKSVSGDSMQLIGNFDGVEVQIEGYIPPTCRIVEEEVVVPAVPEHTMKVRKVVCEEEREDVIEEQTL